MPCDIEDHAGFHNWPNDGDLRIWPCERACDYCTYQARDSSALRAHVRDVHQPGDYPLIHILPGLNRPPVFNPALHGTPLRVARATLNGYKQHPSALSDYNIDPAVQQGAAAAESLNGPEHKLTVDPDDDDEYHDGPSSSAARGRRIHATPKAMAAQEEASSRKRKRSSHQRIPGEIFPARLPKIMGGGNGGGSVYGSPHAATAMSDSVRAARGLLRPRTNLSPDAEEALLAWFKSNVNGLFYLGHAAGLSRRDIAVACQDVVNHWTFNELDE